MYGVICKLYYHLKWFISCIPAIWQSHFSISYIYIIEWYIFSDLDRWFEFIGLLEKQRRIYITFLKKYFLSVKHCMFTAKLLLCPRDCKQWETAGHQHKHRATVAETCTLKWQGFSTHYTWPSLWSHCND